MSTETMASDSLELKPGLAGFFDDWSSDQRAFKGVPGHSLERALIRTPVIKEAC